jgi:hypothetical protein
LEENLERKDTEKKEEKNKTERQTMSGKLHQGLYTKESQMWRKDDHGNFVPQSAGLGLFCHMDLKRNTKLGNFKGEYITNEEYNNRFRDGRGQYAIKTPGGYVLDCFERKNSAEDPCLLSMANSPVFYELVNGKKQKVVCYVTSAHNPEKKRIAVPNVSLTQHGTGTEATFGLTTTCRIPAGTEILWKYGSIFWKNNFLHNAVQTPSVLYEPPLPLPLPSSSSLVAATSAFQGETSVVPPRKTARKRKPFSSNMENIEVVDLVSSSSSSSSSSKRKTRKKQRQTIWYELKKDKRNTRTS